MSPFPRGGPTIEGWKAKSKLASVCPVGTLEKRSLDPSLLWLSEFDADEPVARLDALLVSQALLGEVADGAEVTERTPMRSAGPRPGERDESSPPPGDSAEPPSGSVLDESAHNAKLGAPSGSDPSDRDHSAGPSSRAKSDH